MGKRRNSYRKKEEEDHWEDKDVDGWIILQWILER
jgi:hypothetical protein